jgi:hypothetical protein
LCFLNVLLVQTHMLLQILWCRNTLNHHFLSTETKYTTHSFCKQQQTHIPKKKTQSPYSLYRNKSTQPIHSINNNHTSPKNTVSILSLQKQSTHPIHSCKQQTHISKKHKLHSLSTETKYTTHSFCKQQTRISKKTQSPFSLQHKPF